MTSWTKRPSLSLVLAAALLVVGLDWTTYAATGDSLLLGRTNAAGRTTTLTNTGAGPALRLRTRPGAPPLAVTSNGKVARLHADLLDGKDAGDLGVRSLVYETAVDTVSDTEEMDVLLADVPAGRYLFTVSGVVYHGTAGLLCRLYVGSDLAAQAHTPPTNTGIHDLGMTAFIDVPRAQTLRLEVDSTVPYPYWQYGGEPLQVVLTRVDGVRHGTATAGIPQT